MKKAICGCMLALILSTGLSTCSGSETKKVKFIEKALRLYEKGDYIHARLELKNAIQIDPKFAQGYYHLGRVELKTAEFSNAVAYFRKAVQLNPQHLDAQLELGKIYLAGGATETALEIAELVLLNDKENTQGIQLKAGALLQKKELAAANSLLDELIKKGITDEDTYLLIANAALQAKDQKKAESQLKKGIAINRDSVKLRSLQADMLMASRQFTEAEAVLEKIIKIAPKEIDHTLRLSELLWQTNRPKEAIQRIDAMVSENPSDVSIRLIASQTYKQKAAFHEAESILKEGFKKNNESAEIYPALMELYLDQNKLEAFQRTLNECRELLSEEKNDFELRIQMLQARASLTQGSLSAAEAAVDDVLSADPQNADAHYIRARIHLMNHENSAAIQEFKTVIDLAPHFDSAHISLAQTYLIEGEEEKALRGLKKAVNDLPTSKNLRLALAKAHTLRKEYRLAEAQLLRLTEYRPLDTPGYIQLGDFYLTTNQFVKAEQIFSGLIKRQQEGAQGYLKLSQVYQKQGRPQKALAVLAKAQLSTRSEGNKILAGRMQLLLDQNKSAEAISICNQHLSQDPKNEFVLNLRGTIHSRQKNDSAAEKDFKKAIALTPQWADPQANLARLYLTQGKEEKAIANFEAALQFKPKDADVYLDLAGIYVEKKNYPKAIEVYRKALVVHPNMWAAANNMAFCLAEFMGTPDDLQHALTLIRRAQFYTPYNAYVEDTLAWILYKQGRQEKARKVMETVLAGYPDNPIFNYHMGTILVKGGMTSAAREKLESALDSKEQFAERPRAEALLAQIDKTDKKQ